MNFLGAKTSPVSIPLPLSMGASNNTSSPGTLTRITSSGDLVSGLRSRRNELATIRRAARVLRTQKIRSAFKQYSILLTVLMGVCAFLIIRSGVHNIGHRSHFVFVPSKIPFDEGHQRLRASELTSSGNYRVRSVGRAAIAVFLRDAEEMSDLCLTLRSLKHLRSEDEDDEVEMAYGNYLEGQHESSPRRNAPETEPVLVFNEGRLSPRQMELIQGCTNRYVFFPIVDLTTEKERSIGIREIEERQAEYTNRILRFWAVYVWKHPAVQQFDTVMKIDTKSCFLDPGRYINPGYRHLPQLHKEYVYQCNYEGETTTSSDADSSLTNLYDFVQSYMVRNDVVPTNPELWNKIKILWRTKKSLPAFQTGFEVMRRSFYQRRDVAAWHEALMNELEHITLISTSDVAIEEGSLRVFTAAIFGTKESILLTRSEGYTHGSNVCANTAQNVLHQASSPRVVTNSENIKPQPKSPPKGVAWLLTFPKLHAHVLSNFVTKATGTATGTNNGNELISRGHDYSTIPGFVYTPDGPFKLSAHPFPSGGYFMTRTSCTSYCIDCPPSQYMMHDATRFAKQCATGVKLHPNQGDVNEGTRGRHVGIRYNLDIVKRAVHAFTDPFDHIVNLFLSEESKMTKAAFLSGKPWAPRYSRDRDGLDQWCLDTFGKYHEEEDNTWDPELVELSSGIPCRAVFYQYVQWHDHVLTMLNDLKLPSMDFYFEDLYKGANAPLSSVLKFLDLTPTSSEQILPTNREKWNEYGKRAEYFSPEDQLSIGEFIRYMSSPQLYAKLTRYTEAAAIPAAAS